jgi:hypothetical protein
MCQLCWHKKIAAAKARAGRKFLSPETPFLPAPPERKFLSLPREARHFSKSGIFDKIGSSGVV